MHDARVGGHSAPTVGPPKVSDQLVWPTVADRLLSRAGEVLGLRVTRKDAMTTTTDLYYDPYDVEIDADPVPGLPPAPRRGAALLQRAATTSTR